MSLPLLVDYTYFTQLPLLLPVNGNDNDIVVAAKRDSVDAVSLERQEEILRMLLGDIEFQNYNDDWNGSAFDSQRWTDFTDGVNITVNGLTSKWGGIRKMLKFFVYYWNKREIDSIQTETGTRQPIDENSVQTFSMHATNAWNKGVYLFGQDHNGLNEKINTSRIHGINHGTDIIRNNDYKRKSYPVTESYKPSAYNFLYYYNQGYSIEFPNWFFNDCNNFNTQPINAFGI